MPWGCPVLYIKAFVRAQGVNFDIAEGERGVRAADFGRSVRALEVPVSSAHDRSVAVGIEQNGSALVNGDVSNFGSAPVLKDAGHEGQQRQQQDRVQGLAEEEDLDQRRPRDQHHPGGDEPARQRRSRLTYSTSIDFSCHTERL